MTAAVDATAEVAQPEDLELARRCAAGDRAAQRELFRGHRVRVHRTLYRILGPSRDLEDLIQDAFLEVFRSLARFRGEAKLSTWIARITTRVAFAHIARRKPATASLDLVPAIEAGGPTVLEVAMARQAGARLYAALEKIDPRQRVAYALHAIEGLPLKEVAEMTDASVVAVKSRIWRCRRELARKAKGDPLLAALLEGEDA